MIGSSVHQEESLLRRRPARSVVSLVPVALLLAVIAGYGFQVVANEDDPQRGGAFAMFATIDIGATRKVLATAEDGAVLLDLPPSLDGRVVDLLDHPSEDSATALASDLRALTWTVDGTTAVQGGAVTFDGVRLQVVGFDADGRMIGRRVLVDVAVGSGS